MPQSEEVQVIADEVDRAVDDAVSGVDANRTVVMGGTAVKVPKSHFLTHLGPGQDSCRFCRQAKQRRKQHRRRTQPRRRRYVRFG